MKRRFSILAILIAANLGQHLAAQAQSTKEPPVQEVFQTELVYPQGKGELQLTTGLDLGKKRRALFVQLPVSLEYGISDRWQVGVQWGGVKSIHPPFGSSLVGTGDLSIGTKYSFMNVANTNLHLAAGFEVGLPAGDNGMSEGLVEFEPFVIAAQDFTALNNLQVFTQLGFRFGKTIRHDLQDEEAVAPELNWNAGFLIPVRRLCITTEFNLVASEQNDGGIGKRRYLTPGLVWRLPDAWEIGIGAPIGVGRRTPVSSVSIKLTREF